MKSTKRTILEFTVDEKKLSVTFRLTKKFYSYKMDKGVIRKYARVIKWELTSERFDFYNGARLKIKEVLEYAKWYTETFGTCTMNINIDYQ